MVQIKLHNFRGHSDQTFTFSDSAITLLRGNSGAGKSTIFQALAWALYGGLQRIYPQVAGSNTMTWVEASLGPIVIYRQRHPELFRVTYQGQTYEDDVAQGLINNFFGSKEAWYACCYILQGNRNSLLTASNGDKMRLIHELSFSQEDPEVYINKLEDTLAQKKSALDIARSHFERDCNTLQEAMARQPFNTELYIPPGNSLRDIFIAKHQEAKEELARLQSQSTQQTLLRGQCKLLREQQERLVSCLQSLPQDDKGIQELESKLQRMLIHEQWQQYRDQMNQVEALLLPLTSIPNNYTLQDLIQTKANLQRYQENEERAKRLQVPYTQEAIQNEIQRLNSELVAIVTPRYTETDLIRASTLEERSRASRALADKYGLDYAPDTVKSALSHIEARLESIGNGTEKELLQLKLHQERYKASKLLTDKYQLPYGDVEGLHQVIAKLELLREAEDFRGPFTSYHPRKEAKVTAEDLQKIEEQITQAQQSSNVIRCPHCRNGVRFISGKLHLSTVEPISPRVLEQLYQEKARLHDIYKAQQEQAQIEMALAARYGTYKYLPMFFPDWTKVELNSLPPFDPLILQDLKRVEILPDRSSELSLLEESLREKELLQSKLRELKQIEFYSGHPDVEEIKKDLVAGRRLQELQHHLEQLMSIEVIPMPPSLSLIQQSLEKQRCEREISKLQEKMGTLIPCSDYVPSATLQGELTLLKSQREEARRVERQLGEIASQLQNVLSQYDGDFEAKLSQASQIVQQYQLQYETLQIGDRWREERAKLEKQQQETIALYQDVVNLDRLIAIAREVECHSLQATVDSINHYIEEVTPYLFDDPITIRLSLFKQLKSKDKMKMMVNINISYRGGEYDNINQLSGGEGDRLSLVLTLALAKMTSCPFLLLDECFSALDGGLKEASLKTLRKALPGKTIICIDHDCVSGYYDAEVALS